MKKKLPHFFVEDDLLKEYEEHPLQRGDMLLLSGNHLTKYRELNIKRGRDEALKEVKKIMGKLVRSGSGDIAYWEMIEQIKKLEKK